jgi:hypothetical protein
MRLVLRDALLADSRRVDISVDDGRVIELKPAAWPMRELRYTISTDG